MNFKHANSKIKHYFLYIYGCLFHAGADQQLYIIHCTVPCKCEIFIEWKC